MARPGAPSAGEFVDLPEKEWLKCEITEAKIEEGEYQGKPRTQVKVTFEVLDEEYLGSKLTYWAGFSLHEKSKLRPLAEAVTGKTGDELYETFDTDDLVGKEVMVMGETHHYKKDGEDRSILKPTIFKAINAGRRRPAATSAPAASPAPAGDDLDI